MTTAGTEDIPAITSTMRRDQEVQHIETRKAGGSAETLQSSLYRMANAKPTYFDCDSFAIINILNILDSWRLGSCRLSITPKD